MTSHARLGTVICYYRTSRKFMITYCLNISFLPTIVLTPWKRFQTSHLQGDRGFTSHLRLLVGICSLGGKATFFPLRPQKPVWMEFSRLWRSFPHCRT